MLKPSLLPVIRCNVHHLISAVESKPTLRLYEPHLAPRSNVTGFVIKKNSARISNRKTPTPLRISELLPEVIITFSLKQWKE
jgi:hypothetical protein